MTAYKGDTLQTCDVFNTIAKNYGADAAAKFMRDVNRTRLEREIEAEQLHQRQLIEHAESLRGKPRDVSRRDPWLMAQERITRSFVNMDALMKEYEAAK
jgi:hypothetical protein